MDIENLAAKAATVAREYEAASEAIGDRHKAEAELLAVVVEKIKPALRALSSRIKAQERTWWPTNVTTAEDVEYHDARGVPIAGDGLERDHPRANSGRYEGRRLWLLDDGTFAVSEYEGTWSRWQGAESRWECGLLRITSPETIAREWKVDEIIAALSEAIDRQVGTREGVAKKASARAEQLRAITALLKR